MMAIMNNVTLIAACGASGQLGLNGELPWHDPEDLKWFKQQTTGGDKVLVVGYATAQKLPPLPGRFLHVMQRDDTPADIIRRYPGSQIMVIGGGKTYRQWLPYVRTILLNKVNYDGPADTFMPPLWKDGESEYD